VNKNKKAVKADRSFFIEDNANYICFGNDEGKPMLFLPT
jgi:hypothetical protein